MDPSDIPSLGHDPAPCDVVTHLEWTLAINWRTALESHLPDPAIDERGLQPGWKKRASSWRTGQEGTDAWVDSLDASQTPSWSALQTAHTAAGLNSAFRAGPAAINGRHHGWYQDLERRMSRKFDVDGHNDVPPMARAIRGFLDITHTRPFAAGNTRAACNWLVWSLVGAGIDIPDLGPLIDLPKPPAEDDVVFDMVELLVA